MLEHLIATMNADREIDQIKSNLGEYSQKYQELKAIYDLKAKAVSDIRLKHETMQGAHRDMDEKFKSEEIRLQKSKSRLNEIKTNFEFQAMKREVDATEKSNTELQGSLTKTSEDLTGFQATLKTAEEELAALEEQLQEAKKLMDEKNNEIASDIEKKMSDKLEHEGKIDKAILSKYRQIRDKKHPDALVELLDGACQGCFMSIPHQIGNDLIRTAGVFQCPHCMRLMYKKVQH